MTHRLRKKKLRCVALLLFNLLIKSLLLIKKKKNKNNIQCIEWYPNLTINHKVF